MSTARTRYELAANIHSKVATAALEARVVAACNIQDGNARRVAVELAEARDQLDQLRAELWEEGMSERERQAYTDEILEDLRA